MHSALVVSLFALSLLLVLAAAYPTSYLHFRPDGTFKVAFFTDLHLGEDDGDDAQTVASILRLLDMERPDFVVFGGDIFSDYAKPAKVPKSEAWVRTQWVKFTRPLVARSYQWAVVLGNHDTSEMTHYQTSVLDASFAGSWTAPNAYVVPIFGNATYNVATNVAAKMWFFDSGARGVNKWDMEQYASVSDAQPAQGIPSLGFVHLPPLETLPIFNFDNQLRGTKARSEVVSCQLPTDADPAFNFLDVLRSKNEVKILTFGHDHGSNFVGSVAGVHLAYGQKTGHAGYGHWKSGARVFFLRKYDAAMVPSGDLVVPVLPDDANGVQLVRRLPGGAAGSSITMRTWIRFDDGTYDHQTETRGRPSRDLLPSCDARPPRTIAIPIVAFAAVAVLSLVHIARVALGTN